MKPPALTESDIQRIRHLHAEGHPAAALAAASSRSIETIRRILRRETWSWVPDSPQPSSQDAAASQERLLAHLRREGVELGAEEGALAGLEAQTKEQTRQDRMLEELGKESKE